MDNFNFKPDVFVFGASMGGISSTNLVLFGSIPVIAHGGHEPQLVGDPVDNPAGNVNYGDEVLKITPVVEAMSST